MVTNPWAWLFQVIISDLNVLIYPIAHLVRYLWGAFLNHHVVMESEMMVTKFCIKFFIGMVHSIIRYTFEVYSTRKLQLGVKKQT